MENSVNITDLLPSHINKTNPLTKYQMTQNLEMNANYSSIEIPESWKQCANYLKKLKQNKEYKKYVHAIITHA